MVSSPAPRVPDLHKSAFWIYGVTAMVMREPLSIVLHHAVTAGWADPTVVREGLRTLIVLLLMSKQFLASGIYFDRVYIQPESAERFPRRSYPTDFLFGMAALLVAVGASTVIGSPPPMFDRVAGAMLLSNAVWIAVSKVASYSTVARIAPAAISDIVTLAVFAASLLVFGEAAGYVVLLLLLLGQIAHLIRNYAAV